MQASEQATILIKLLVLLICCSTCVPTYQALFDVEMGGGNSEAQRSHELRKQLRLKHREQILEANPDQRAKNRASLREEVMQFVSIVPVFILRLCHVSLEVFGKNKDEPHWHLSDASKALVVIERFALNLWDHPWKKELRLIKQYTGVYQGHIEKYLKGSELYFRLVGYEALPGRILKTKQVIKEDVANGAFDIFLDVAYFEYLGNIHDLVHDQGYTTTQVWNARDKFTGTPEEVAKKMQEEMKPAITVGVGPKIFGSVVSPEHFAMPEKKVATPAVAGKDSGYVSKPASREIPREELEQIQKHTKKDLLKRPQIEDKNIENLSKQLGNLAQRHSDEPATIDEHVDMSLRALRKKETNQKDTVRTENPIPEDSWAFMNRRPHGMYSESADFDERDAGLQRPKHQYQNPDPFQTATEAAAVLRKNNRFSQNKSNGLSLSIETPEDDDLWVPSFPSDNKKPQVAAEKLDENNSKVRHFLEDATKAPQQTQLGFSTFGKESSPARVQQVESPPYPYNPHHYSLTSPTPPKYCFNIGGEVQSDCVDDKVGQLLRRTDRELDETLQKPLRSSYGNMSEFMSLPDVSGAKLPTAPRRNVTEVVSTKPGMRGHGAASARVSKLSPISSSWQCKACTYINTEQAPVCFICGKSRDVITTDLTALRSGTPQCPKCTLVNEERSRFCRACKEPLKGCPTYF